MPAPAVDVLRHAARIWQAEQAQLDADRAWRYPGVSLCTSLLLSCALTGRRCLLSLQSSVSLSSQGVCCRACGILHKLSELEAKALLQYSSTFSLPKSMQSLDR